MTTDADREAARWVLDDDASSFGDLAPDVHRTIMRWARECNGDDEFEKLAARAREVLEPFGNSEQLDLGRVLDDE